MIYGGKWKIVPNSQKLGSGGQSEVFRVLDTTSSSGDHYAMKRILNPKRHDRFRREIDVIKKLQHPNIIRLVDHSALEANTSEKDKQFIVMPLAEGGDLSAPARVQSFKGNLEATINTAKQIASALLTAHQMGVIHRDVKPQNILFPHSDNSNAWVTDFGICFLRDELAITGEQEVVGPRWFIAPEIDGVNDQVASTSADIYSLGKVIFFMATGGITLRREEINDERYRAIFATDGQHRLLKLLVGRMVTEKSNRLPDMSAVLGELERIEEWEKSRNSSPLSAATLATLQKMHDRKLLGEEIEQRNNAAREKEKEALQTVTEIFESWLYRELNSISKILSQNGLNSYIPSSDELDFDLHDLFRLKINDSAIYSEISSTTLLVDTPYKQHKLNFYLSKKSDTFPEASSSRFPTEHPFQDTELLLLPYYGEYSDLNLKIISSLKKESNNNGFLSAPKFIGKPAVIFPPPDQSHRQPRQIIIQHITEKFSSKHSIHHTFKVSEWPRSSEKIQQTIAEAIDNFISFLHLDAK